MGGRSKKPNEFTESFSFLSDLSDSRLENYGKYSSMAFQNGDSKSFTQTGKPSNVDSLNIRAAEEYEKRHGSGPPWDLSSNAGVHKSYDGYITLPKR